MIRAWLVFFCILLLAAIGGSVYLMLWEIPAPQREVTRTIDNDRFVN